MEAPLLSVFMKELGPKQNYMCIHNLYGSYMGPVQSTRSNGVSDSYIDAVFKLVIHDESELWTRPSHSFAMGGLLQLSEFLQFLYKFRY